MGLNQVGVRELRQNLSQYLRRVASGERLEVTERGKRVAVLAPLSDPSLFDPLDVLEGTPGDSPVRQAHP